MANEKRLIDANALLKELDKFLNPMPDEKGLHFLSGLSTAITEIEDAPTVDAVEVVHAYWTGSRFNPMNDEYEEYCSHCCAWSSEYGKPYCPNCGAYMRGDGNV